MGTPSPRLEHLRQEMARLDPSLMRLPDERLLALGIEAADTALAGGLAYGTVHEFAPVAPIHLAAATGFAFAVTAMAARHRGQMLWITTDYAVREAGLPYGPGLQLYGIPPERLLVVRVARPLDALWAMEEALRCPALTATVAELGDDHALDLTVTRRLVLAAREGGGFGCLLRHRCNPEPSAAATRWSIAAAPSEPDRYGGLGPTTFDLALTKNRRGLNGRWTITWNPHERCFQPAIPVGVAETVADRPDRAPSRHAI